MSRISRSIWWLTSQFARKLFRALAAAAEESQNLGLFRPADTPVMRLFVRIVLSNYNGLWQVRILLPRPSRLRLAFGDKEHVPQ